MSLSERQRLAHDFHRPRYHFVAPAHWMNDPNGVIDWDGKLHLFYQYNPDAAQFGTMCWGHAVSDDFIHWTDLPIALRPTPGGPDERGCWSGCTVNNGGIPTIVYTGARGESYEIQTQCLAVSHDDLLTWEKYDGNPVLSDVPAESGQRYDFRDPFVWRDGDRWTMVLASRIVGVGGTAFLYQSPDLIHWEYLHPLLTGSAEHGSVWECPSFFPLGDQWVLVVAGKGNHIPFTVFYFVGDYVNQRFVPTSQGILDHGYFYAPFAMQDRHGRRLLWGWLTEGRSVEAHVAAGWAGAHAIPRELSLRDGQLYMEPISELATLHGVRKDFTNVVLTDEDIILSVEGLSLDIHASFEVSGPVGLALACAPDGSEQTRIVYDPADRRLSIQRQQSSLGTGHETFPNEAAHSLAPGEALELRILLDGSILEVIANGRTSLCSRIYPSRADSQGVRVFGQGRLNTMTVWQMASIWPIQVESAEGI